MDELTTRVAVLETQVKRVVSDIESEKATRSRANAEITARLDAVSSSQAKTDKIVATGVGIVVAVQTLLHYIK